MKGLAILFLAAAAASSAIVRADECPKLEGTYSCSSQTVTISEGTKDGVKSYKLEYANFGPFELPTNDSETQLPPAVSNQFGPIEITARAKCDGGKLKIFVTRTFQGIKSPEQFVVTYEQAKGTLHVARAATESEKSQVEAMNCQVQAQEKW